MTPPIQWIFFASLAAICAAQEIDSGGQTVGATPGTVAPAVAQVPASSTNAAADLFDWETLQLTPAVIANLTELNLTGISLFDFPGAVSSRSTSKCKVFPGDPDYPPPIVWDVFNLLTGGAVIKTVPLAASCYEDWPEYDPAQCANITSRWSDPHLHADDPTSNMWPLYEGLTCVPPSLRNVTGETCTLGGYASYSVAVTSVAQIQLALNLARNAGLRLVVKNTGHDFADKSLGAGALSIWTHGLGDVRFVADYAYGDYRGPAFKLGAGAETADVYAAAEQNGVTAVGGECRTVGIAGGYIAGGGHSPMSSLVGMGADQVLSMEVVLPSGEFITASQTSHPDLFWALRGGGGSTFGVVTSVVVRAYPKIPVTTMTFTYATGPTLSADAFWASIGVYMSYFATFVDAGTYGYFTLGGDGTGGFAFTFDPFWGGNMSQPQLEALVAPYLADLAALGVAVAPVYTEHASFYPAWNASFPPEMVGAWNNHAASRLFPRENFADAAAVNATLAAVRHAVEGGGLVIGYNIKAAANAQPGVSQNNSVNPAWRRTLTHFILAGLWAADAPDAVIANVSETMTTDWMARWRAVSPGAGAYMSEADINEPDFQQSFFGSNYAALYALKQQYDPYGLFYAPQAVGSEDWYVTGQVPWIPTQNGRLCRVS